MVDKFVEYFGPGASSGMKVADRALVANMAPEYGATMGFFPIDEQTLGLPPPDRPQRRRGATGRALREGAATVPQPAQAGGDAGLHQGAHARPGHDRAVPGRARSGRRTACRWREVKRSFRQSLQAPPAQRGFGLAEARPGPHGDRRRRRPQRTDRPRRRGHRRHHQLHQHEQPGRHARRRPAGQEGGRAGADGQAVREDQPGPGQPRGDRLSAARPASTSRWSKLGFHTVGYGCTTCIGNSGPLPEPVAKAVDQGKLVAAAVLSGNRNFEGRINPLVKANYLASPPLVVAYALAGTVDIDLATEPLGTGSDGRPVYLKDIWPIAAGSGRGGGRRRFGPRCSAAATADVFEANAAWNALPVTPRASCSPGTPASTYIQEPPFLIDLAAEPGPIQPIRGARVLAALGDSVTTDHISPAGSIAATSPAGKYLAGARRRSRSISTATASRRGNDRVMTRGTFANIRIRNLLAPGTEGGVTRHLPDGELMPIYDAAMKYKAEGVPLVVLAGAEYGTGSSRDWAAKGTYLLGVRAVLAASFERIHRSNLVGMGVLPLEFPPARLGKASA